MPIKPIPTREIFPPLCIGYMGNNIFPARAGEFIRAIILKQDHGISISASLATILVERIFDGIVVLGFVFLNIGTAYAQEEFQFIAFWGSAIFLSAFTIILLMALFQDKAKQIFEKLINMLVPGKWQGKVSGFLSRFIDGLSTLRSPASIIKVVVTSVVIWTVESAVYWLVMQAFSFNVGFLKLVFLNGVVNLVTTLPSAPGYIGTFEAPGIALLKTFGVSAAESTGFMLVLHAALWLPITTLGAIFFIRTGINLGEDLEEAKKAKVQ